MLSNTRSEHGTCMAWVKDIPSTAPIKFTNTVPVRPARVFKHSENQNKDEKIVKW
jgi:hypothetical protein